MASSAFDDKAAKPDDQMLAEALGKSNWLRREIKEHLNVEHINK